MVLWPWNAAAFTVIIAEILQESKRCVPVLFHEGRTAQASSLRRVPEPHPDGQAAGQLPGCVAEARGSGTAEARARPNVEVNRRAATLVRVEPQVRRCGERCCGLGALRRCRRLWPRLGRMASAVCPSRAQLPPPGDEADRVPESASCRRPPRNDG